MRIWKIGFVLILTSLQGELAFGEETSSPPTIEQAEAALDSSEPQEDCVDEDGELTVCPTDDEVMPEEPQVEDEFIPEEPIPAEPMLEGEVPEEP